MNDAWRDSYDSWKLATPPEHEITPEEEEQEYNYDRDLDFESLMETFR